MSQRDDVLELCWVRFRGDATHRSEEGDRPRAYNDATGQTVTCRPNGNLSIGVGINLETGLDPAEEEWLTKHRTGIVYDRLAQFAWFTDQDAARQSVVVDAGYNQGVEHFIATYPHFISFLASGNLQGAATELRVANQSLDASRYAPLRQILLTGQV